jgi:glycosyltransferase involved in cell wall biosynthesis
LKILFLCHEFPPIGGGGGAWTQDISRFLSHRGHEVQVITSHINKLPRQEFVEGVSIIRLPSFRKEYFRASLQSMLFFTIRSFLYGLHLLRQWKPDIIQVVFAVPAGVSGFLLSKFTGIPYVISAHLGDVPGGVPEKTQKWFRWIFPLTVPVWRNASRITAVSNFTGSLIQENYHLDPIIIPNGYDPEMIPPQEIHLNQPPVIVFAGRFVPQKNLLEFVEIMASVKDLPWKCKLVGDGPLRPLIEEMISKHNLSERFEITGWVKPEEVIDHLRSSDILFMPSLSEGLTIVGVYAVAVGLTIIAYDVGGFDELVINNINGLLIKPGKKQELSEGLRSYLVNPDKLLRARNASLTHAKRFDLNQIVNLYEQIYREVLD